jgi:hypothetical protein
MNWPLVLSVVLVAPVAAQSQQPPDTSAGKNLKDRTVTLRACVQQGTHGSPGNVSQVEVIAPAGTLAGPRKIIYWFFENVNGFKDHAGHQLEITGTVAAVIEGSPELKATDGVFAEVQVPANSAAPAATPVGGDAGAAGDQPDKPVATASNAGDPATDEPPTTVIKAAVTNLKMLGGCR